MASNEETTKKSFYKKWWFWIIVVLVVLVIIGAGGNDEETSKTTLTSSNGTSSSTNTTATEAKKSSYSIGEIYEDNNIAIKFVSADENYTAYNQYADVKEGYKIVKAEFEAENVGTSDAYFSAYEFDCYADGYDCEDFWSFDDSGFSSTLSSGKKAKGTVCFQVPADASSITIEYSLNSFTSEKVEFLVK